MKPIHPGPVPIVIDRDASLAVRRHGGNSIVARFAAPVRLYRIVDGRELVSASRKGVVTGGHFSVPEERAHGASWSGTLEKLVDWGLAWAAQGRLAGGLFVFEVDVPAGTRFYHHGPHGQIAVSVDGEREQRAMFPLSECNTGLGCSAAISIEDVRVYHVTKEGQLTLMSPLEIENFVKSKPKKPIDLHAVSAHFLSGFIADASVAVVQDHTDKLWKVRAGPSPIVAGAKTAKTAAEAALKILQSPTPPGETVYLNRRPRGFAHVEVDDIFERKKGYGASRVSVTTIGASYVNARVLADPNSFHSPGSSVTIHAVDLMRDFRQT